MPKTVESLSDRALNRATLARQMLLERQKVKPLAAIEKLAGMQAQLARPPFIGLWTRLQKFKREDLLRLIERGEVVRATWIRATIHLLSASDYKRFRATIQPSLATPAPPDDITACARDFFTEPRTFDEFRKFLRERDPKCEERPLAYSTRLHVPMTIVASKESRFGYPAASQFTLAGEIDRETHLEELVQRYLAAFGPASIKDMQIWSNLRNLKPVFDSLRDNLVTFRDERGKELFDLPKAPRPGEDVEAPVRFLPDYDNLTLAYADRTRVIADHHRKHILTRNLGILPAFLVDGVVSGTWKIEKKKLTLNPFVKLSKAVKAELEEEGEKLVDFVEGD